MAHANGTHGTKGAYQRGVMLLEALIGILIFSLGILALIGMQAVASKVTLDAKNRAEASNLASQLIGEMWTNRSSLTSYAYSGSGTVPSALTQWNSQVAAALPNAATYPPIVVIGTPAGSLAGVTGNQVTITVRWQPPGGTTNQYQTTAFIN